jgi:hypothetical protein
VPNAATKGQGPYEYDDKECHGNSVHSIMQQAFLLLVLVIIQSVQLYSAVFIQLRLYGHTIYSETNFCCKFLIIGLIMTDWSDHDRWKFPRNIKINFSALKIPLIIRSVYPFRFSDQNFVSISDVPSPCAFNPFPLIHYSYNDCDRCNIWSSKPCCFLLHRSTCPQHTVRLSQR